MTPSTIPVKFYTKNGDKIIRLILHTYVCYLGIHSQTSNQCGIVSLWPKFQAQKSIYWDFGGNVLYPKCEQWRHLMVNKRFRQACFFPYVSHRKISAGTTLLQEVFKMSSKYAN